MDSQNLTKAQEAEILAELDGVDEQIRNNAVVLDDVRTNIENLEDQTKVLEEQFNIAEEQMRRDEQDFNDQIDSAVLDFLVNTNLEK